MLALWMSKLCLNKLWDGDGREIDFTDEMVWIVAQSLKRQKLVNRIIRHHQTIKIPNLSWYGTKLGPSLVLLKYGVKLNPEVYWHDILEAVVLFWTRQCFDNQEWTQCRLTTRKQRKSGARKDKFLDFTKSTEWSRYSPYINQH